MSTLATLKELLAKRILIIDGAMGTMIQRHKLKKPIIVVSVLLIGHTTLKAITTYLC